MLYAKWRVKYSVSDGKLKVSNSGIGKSFESRTPYGLLLGAKKFFCKYWEKSVAWIRSFYHGYGVKFSSL